MAEPFKKLVGMLDQYFEKAMIVLLMSVLVACLTYSSFVRYFITNTFFTSLTHKTEELALFAFTWMLYWGACIATKENAHFRIDAHLAKMPARLQRWRYLPGDLVWVCFNIFVVWQGWLLTKSTLDRPEFSLSLEIHMAFIYIVIPLTFLVTVVRMIQNYYRGAYDKAQGGEVDHV